jgi:hypothetical protein
VDRSQLTQSRALDFTARSYPALKVKQLKMAKNGKAGISKRTLNPITQSADR